MWAVRLHYRTGALAYISHCPGCMSARSSASGASVLSAGLADKRSSSLVVPACSDCFTAFYSLLYSVFSTYIMLECSADCCSARALPLSPTPRPFACAIGSLYACMIVCLHLANRHLRLQLRLLYSCSGYSYLLSQEYRLSQGATQYQRAIVVIATALHTPCVQSTYTLHPVSTFGQQPVSHCPDLLFAFELASPLYRKYDCFTATTTPLIYTIFRSV